MKRVIHWKKIILFALLIGIVVLLIRVLGSQFYYSEHGHTPAANNEPFRMALAVSPFTDDNFKEGYTYEYDGRKITNSEELEQLYIDKGATEMFVRIATKRYGMERGDESGHEYTNATLDQTLALCRISAELNIPINPEVMCAYKYMDMERQEAPNFEEYPEFYSLQHGKDWSQLTLVEIESVLRAYGKFLATEILNTGCTVNNWNLGNEANFGFAGISLGLETAVNPKLADVPDFGRYILPALNVSWLENNVWKYNAKAFAAVRRGILDAYDDLGINASNVKFSTHIATVVMTPGACVRYFNCLRDNGYAVDTAGISFYPSAPSMYLDSMKLFKKTVMKINKECDLPVFIAEFAYPSGEMSGNYAGWNKTVKGYEHTEEGQAAIYQDVIAWGRSHGVSGIRYWAADYENWGTMGMFRFHDKVGTPKQILTELSASPL